MAALHDPQFWKLLGLVCGPSAIGLGAMALLARAGFEIDDDPAS